MAKKKTNEKPSYIENISIEPMDTIMDSRSALYAKDVIQDRAIPDLRDGLKPVQRRIIYSMYRANNTFEHSTRKCAGIVGDVMGKYHPHGDFSIYEALVRMSQEWKMSVPLIKFQGNNGSIDNDPAAAYRYTEAKLNQFSQYLVDDIDKNTVDMNLNFDDTLFEPALLPAKFPNLFVNGGSGIAFAIATEIPPHNLGEMCDATIYRINHPNCTIDDLLNIVKGPDFPTGGIIYKTESLKQVYLTGKGRIDISSKVEIDTSEKDKNKLIIDNIPFGVVKIDLVYSIDKIRKSKDVDGIIDIIDETAGDEVKIVIDLKKEIDPQVVLKYLMNKTQLKISYNANIVAIYKNSPKTLPLIDYLDDFISFQEELVLRKSAFDLKKATERLHIVSGLIKAVSIVNEVINVIRSSKDKQDSKNNLMQKFGFSEQQAEAIVMMRLYRLSNTDIQTYVNEKNGLEAEITDLKETLSTPLKVKHIIIDQLKDVAKKYGFNRRTQIEDEENLDFSYDKRALVAKEDCYITVTEDGYINRSSIKSHDASNDALPKTKDGEIITMCSLCNTKDYILLFTNKGNYIFLPVYEIDEGKFKEQGKHINYITNLPFDETIIKGIIVKDFKKRVSVCCVSKNGQIKKTILSDFFTGIKKKPATCMKLLKSDELVDAFVLNGDSNILILTEKGNITYFNENEISAIGLNTSGVKAISTLKNSKIKFAFAFSPEEKSKLLLLTDNKMFRIFENTQVELTSRLGKTQVAFKSFKSDLHNLVYAEKILDKDNPIILHCLLSDDSVVDVQINDFYLTPIDKYCKQNILFENKNLIKKVYINYTEIIDKNTIENISKTVENKINSADGFINEEKEDSSKEDKEESENYEQISIFDDMGD